MPAIAAAAIVYFGSTMTMIGGVSVAGLWGMSAASIYFVAALEAISIASSAFAFSAAKGRQSKFDGAVTACGRLIMFRFQRTGLS